MKVLQLAKFPPESRGGIEKIARRISVDLSTPSFRCDIVCFDENSKSRIDVFYNFTVYRCRTLFKLMSVPFSIHNLYFIKKLINSYDSIHVHMPNPNTELYILLLWKYVKRLTVHYHADLSHKNSYRLYAWLEKKILAKASKIVVTTESLKKSNSLSKFQNKVTVIPSYLSDSDYVSTPAAECSSEVLESSNKSFFLFVGRLTSYKRVDILINAFKNIDSSCRLIIVGSGEESSRLISLAGEMMLSGKIIFLDNVSDSEKKYLYKNALATILPSISSAESYGYVQVESMAQGTPVISFEIANSGVSEINIDGKTGLVIKASDIDSENIDHLASAINQLLSDKEMASALSLGAREHSRLFSKSENVAKYISFFN